MIFAKLGVDVYTHPRFLKAGYEASGYWMHALAYLRHHESSDGFLAEEFITVPLTGKKAQCRRLCEKLVSVGLFQRVEGGYVLLRYAEKNDTKNVIEVNKAAARERKSRGRFRPGVPVSDPPKEVAVTRDTTVPVTRPDFESVTRRVSPVPSGSR